MQQPNLVYHVYKVRRGKINHVKIWAYFDFSTCRNVDIFATDNDYHLLNLQSTTVDIILDKTTEDRPFSMGNTNKEDKDDAGSVWF